MSGVEKGGQGSSIATDRFDDRIAEELAALESLLSDPSFGLGQRSIGAELEVHLVDAGLLPAPINVAVRRRAEDARIAVELNRYNLEINALPVVLGEGAFAALGRELSDALSVARRAAASLGADVAAIGILPTLRINDLGANALTELPRFQALSRALRGLRGGPFEVEIEGEELLHMSSDDVTPEGATASLQVHLRVAPSEFARVYNAAQLATAPVLSVSGNSPFFFGQSLWCETRVALFHQAVDERGSADRTHRAARVGFGHGWVRDPVDLFRESVALFRPLEPVVATVLDSGRSSNTGHAPELVALRAHHGTVWSWNRAVYDPSCAGHLRIELRTLPAGPTVVDMCANAALLVGLSLGLATSIDTLITKIPFEQAARSFLRAARDGLEAQLAWPVSRAPSPALFKADELVLSLLPTAQRGLEEAGVSSEEARSHLDVIRGRIERQMTGAVWQRRALERAGARTRKEALKRTLARYLAHARSEQPVHRWPCP